jgi:hypothetical protein
MLFIVTLAIISAWNKNLVTDALLPLYLLMFLLPFRYMHSNQNYVFQHLTSKEGLSSDYIPSIYQDSKGFYWIGTLQGCRNLTDILSPDL